jgi:FkbM family methyltransferase
MQEAIVRDPLRTGMITETEGAVSAWVINRFQTTRIAGSSHQACVSGRYGRTELSRNAQVGVRKQFGDKPQPIRTFFRTFWKRLIGVSTASSGDRGMYLRQRMGFVILRRNLMHKVLRALARSTLNTLPRRVAGNIVGRAPRLVPYLDERDLPIKITNCYYGHATFVVSTRYRIERLLLYAHTYDEKTLLYLMRVVSPGDVCLDIGANIGAITLSLAYRVGPRGRVLAFEPGPPLFDRLTRNVEATRLRNVESYRVGIGGQNATLYWRLDEGENAGNAVLSQEATSTPVPVVRLDDCAAVGQLNRIDFIKIDVEGMELSVVHGALTTIARFKPHLLIETRRDDGPVADDVHEMLSLLSDLGYEHWEIDVPQSRLKTCKADFNFIKCEYPVLPQNTLCIHVSRRHILGASAS